MSPARSVTEVLARCTATHGWAVGMCGQFCAAMYGYDSSGYASAYVQWQQTPPALRHPGTSDAPAGALYYWSGGPSGHGHVTVADGTGSCWSIDILGAGTVGRVPVTQISQQWGLPYLGWAYPFIQGQEWSPTMIYGLDVAAFQPGTIPLRTPGDSKPVQFAFTKATQGTSYVNPLMNAQSASARSQGMIAGFYHFLEKGNIQAQAQYFVDKAASLDGDVFACDWETNPATNTYATSAEKDQFIRAVQALRPGHRVLLYCNTSFWKGVDTSSFAGDGLWIATAGYAAGKPPIQSAWLLHQYSTAGNYDHDVAQFSDQGAMRTWAGGDADMAITDADALKIAKAVFNTDGILESPADAADHTTNPFWTFATYVKDTGGRTRAAAAVLAAVQAQAKSNGSGITALATALSAASVKVDLALATLEALDLDQLPAEIAAKLNGLKFVLQEGE